MIYKIADPAISIFGGALTAFIITCLVPPEWNMFWSMLAGCAIGMSVMTVLGFTLMPWCGSFEIMIPLSINTMIVGMVTRMGSFLDHLPSATRVGIGGLIGFAVYIAVENSNRRLRGSF